MSKNLLNELDKAMKERNIKIPALAVRLGIPKERMYKWYQQGTNPKADDSVKVWDWINGEKSFFVVEEEQAEYQTIPSLIRIIEKQQETIHYLTTGKSQGDALSKKA